MTADIVDFAEHRFASQQLARLNATALELEYARLGHRAGYLNAAALDDARVRALTP